jgi:hypothetical protein
MQASQKREQQNVNATTAAHSPPLEVNLPQEWTY